MQGAQEKAAVRYHDLDALRAVAMILGIALHGALSFVPFPWSVQDSEQHELFGTFFFMIHGFRMPVFFVMSGFFTAMLWRRRGLASFIFCRRRVVFKITISRSRSRHFFVFLVRHVKLLLALDSNPWVEIVRFFACARRSRRSRRYTVGPNSPGVCRN